MTIYRCVCNICTGYIRSYDSPDYFSEEFKDWQEEWGKQCTEFLGLNCHQHQQYSDGCESENRFNQYAEDEEQHVSKN